MGRQTPAGEHARHPGLVGRVLHGALATYLYRTIVAALILPAVLGGCSHEQGRFHTFADYPGFSDYYHNPCQAQEATADERRLLERYKPRFIMAPDSTRPLDFYRDYLPNTRLRHMHDSGIRVEQVTKDLLKQVAAEPGYFLDFDWKAYKTARKASGPAVVYGRVYKEQVTFPHEGNTVTRRLTFLKYNLVFPVSGLPAKLNFWSRMLLSVSFMDRQDWHELDHYVAATVVLDEAQNPIALILAQHNHHRSFLLGRHASMPDDGRAVFEIAERSNELYLSSPSPQPSYHRVIRWSLYFKYLLTGEGGPWLTGQDISYSKQAGGREIAYRLDYLSSCDPFYRAKIMLGEPRSFLGMYIGRDGPPGADYYTVPALLPQGHLLKASYFHEGNERDVAVLEQAIDVDEQRMNIPMLLEYGGGKFYRQWQALD